ncbi:plant intracellular Ras-group-related LRR protein 1-like [Musa acuminata AAA Group]|uniref:plant intracellular Ras-group-related LRR protein 1-like n=1 Tax=Musa acuminata AAA Group TaxID=214697 RepID=UPI0031DAB9A2
MRMEAKTSERAESESDGVKKEQELDLSGMSLDSLPNPSINLGIITKLDLSNNNLQSIPESLTARLLNLVVLDVHSNQLRALPNSIGCLSKLKALNVSGNLMESLPKTIEDCRALQELIANFNQLTKLPDTMGFELTNLQMLAVNTNKLAFLPYSTSHMTSLRVLDARLNCLRALPDGLENLIRLQVLNVGQNFQYLQSLPYAIGLLVSLVELDISYNSITVLPNSMGCLTKLRKFQVEGNPLVCPPTDVVEQGIDVTREYLSARMNGSETGPSSSKHSWIKNLVKCGTFSGRMMSSNISVRDEKDGLLMSDYRSIDGLASPRYVGIFSPRRLFSPRRASPRK